MNHFGEIRALVSFVRPHVAMVTTIAPAHLEFFGTCEAIADAKSEIFEGLAAGRRRADPADSPIRRPPDRARQAGRASPACSPSARSQAAMRGLIARDETDDGMNVEADILGKPCHFRIGAPGAHIAANAVGALLAVARLDGDVLNAAAALSQFHRAQGPGRALHRARRLRHRRGHRRKLQRQSVVDGGGVSRFWARRTPSAASPCSATCWRWAPTRAPITPVSPAMWKPRAPISSSPAGRSMKALWDALPASRRGAYGETSSDIAGQGRGRRLARAMLVLVKGSFGSRMAVIIDALKARAAG